jgi:gliding motility-associated-like protein
MWKKLLFLRMEALLPTLLFLLLFALKIGSAHATTYYWVGGSGSWVTSVGVNHWSLSSGGAPLSLATAPPTVTDDVIFDANSGFTTGFGNSTVSFTNTAVVRNITVSGCLPAPTFNFTNSSQFFDIYGNADFQAGMNFTNFLCKTRFFSTPSSLNKIINTNGNTFYGPWKVDAGGNGSTATITFNGDFTLRNGFEINTLNSTDKVIISGTPNFIAAGYNPYPSPQNNLDVLKGEIYFDNGFDGYSGSTYKFLVGQNGKLFSKANGSIYGLHNSGIMNLNYAGTNPEYSVAEVTHHNTTLAAMLDYHQTTINVYSFWNYGSGTSGPHAMTSAGSLINFKSTSTALYTYNYAFGSVNIEPAVSTFNIYGSIYGISNITPTFDNFTIRRNTYYNQPAAPSIFTFTSNNFKVYPGVTVAMQYAIAKISVTGICDITGLCESPIKFVNTNFVFGGGTTVLSDYIFTEGISATGPSTPYNPGSGSRVISGGSSGWNFTTSVGRTLIWVGPIPSAANLSNPLTYGLWENSANWRDAAFFPTATPNNPIGIATCPPTFRDSVVFPNNSYVMTNPTGSATGIIYSSGVNFIGTGRIYGSATTEWEIFAGLTFSTGTTNDFFGTVRFRNDKNYECKIVTKNVPFQAGVVMNPVNPSGSWRLTDGDLIALNYDEECDDGIGASGEYSFRIYNGNFHTGLTNCTLTGSYNMNLRGFCSTGGNMNWYGSDIIITRELNYLAGLLNCGISHLKFIPPLNSGIISNYGNQTYYKVSFLSPGGGGYTMSLAASSGTAGVIDNLYINANVLDASYSYLYLNGNTSGSPGTVPKIRKMVVDAPNHIFGVSWGATPTTMGQIDSLILNGNSRINQRLRIRSYISFAPGKQYLFFPGASPAVQMDLLGPTSEPSYSTCVPMPTSYTGAMTNFNGSCSQFINIDNGIFNVTSPHPINAQYLNIKNNSIVGTTGFNANGILTTTSGWNISVSPARKLKWVDNSGTANNIGDWNDPSHWEQLLPSYAMAPQCPPTKVDTVIFENASFPMPGQAFRVNTPLEVASMYWENTGGNTPRLLGNATIAIYGSLKLPAANLANFMTGNTSSFEFRGVPTAQFPSFTIRANGQRIRGNTLFQSASDNARWDLQDSLALAKFTLNRGKFYTNGNPIYSVGVGAGFYITALNATDLRTMDITNSNIWTFIGSGAPWSVSNLGSVTNTTINASGSNIYTGPEAGGNGTFIGGGYKYHNVYMKPFGISGWPATMGVTNGDEFDYIEASAGIVRINGGPNLKAKRIKTTSPNFEFSSTLSIIDTIELLGASNKILSSNRFRDMFEVAPGTTFISGANQVQWFDNDCPVNLLGTSSANIQMYSSVTNVPSYLRKDSATVCADYIYIKDIWGIGNGNNPGACNSYAQTGVNTNCTPSPANAWIVSSCDTITDDASSCGPWKPTQATRGRAAFTAGSYADNQSGNAGWDYRPYPPVPLIQLATSSPSICVGQSVPLTITGVGAIPFYMDYTDNHGNTYSVDITNVAQLASYNATTNAFTYTTSVSPTVSTTYSAGVIAIERCFNNVSPTGTGSLAVTVNPYPQINNAVLATDVCSGNAVTITPTTTVPATVNWTSTSYSGVTGHSTSGSGTITETMNTSNAAPTAVVYTLTPTANGCTGTPVDFTVNLNPRPNVVPGATQNLDCNTPTAVVSASSSTPGVQFGWTGPGVVSGDATNAATVNAAGTYSVLVTNPATGCTSTSSVTVNYIADNVNPTITCPSNISVNTSTTTCNASVAVPNPTINDNCGVTLLTWSMGGVTPGSSPGSGINYVGTQTFNLGTTPVTYTIRDASNNQTTCSFNITVIDNVNPTITCPANMSAFTSSSSCSASVVTPNPTVSDNCTVSALNWTITQGATTVATGSGNLGTRVFSLGTSTVTYTVTDASGNLSNCSYTVTITDNVNPTISCPSNMTAFTSAASCSANVATPNPTVSDNCTVASLSWTITQGAIVQASGTGNLGTHAFNLGTSTVNYIVTDGSGNTSNCSYTVTVTDNVNPLISCPSNMSAFTSSLSCSASVATPNPTVSDNCTIASLSWTITQGALVVASGTGNAGTQVFNLGTSTVNYTATDAAGNSTGCSYTVTVTDNVAPTINCPSNVTANTSSTSCDASIAIPNVTFSDNCTVSSVTWIMSGATVGTSPSSGINQVGTQTFNSGTTTIFYTVRDAANNPATCSFTVTVTDATPPVVQPLDTVFGQCSASVPVAVANDNCSSLINGTTSDPLSYNAQGTFTVTWTFTDAAGNSTISNQVVVVDNNLPLTAPVLPVIYGECSATVPYPDLASGCSGIITGTTSDPLYYDQQGTYTVTWNFDDGMGNTVNANQTVIVDDTTAAVPDPIPNVLTECSVTLSIPIAIDNCVDTIYGTTTFPTTYSAQGTFTLTWTFDDGNGNPINVNQTVIVADTTDPTFSNCPANISVSNDNGDCGALVSWTPPTAADNCSGFTVTSSHNPGDFFDLGTTTVTYTLTDAGGNTTTCTFDVEVTDNEAPVIIACPADNSVSTDPLICGAVVNWTLPTANDNCPGVTMTYTHNSGDLFPTGTTTVTYTATDAAGNTATCSFDVTVTDTEAPVFTDCPSDITVNNDPGVCGAVVNWPAPTATDNCSAVTLTSNYNPGDLFPTGTTVVTYTATDAIGNSFTCSFDVTVNDVEEPVISGLSDISVCEGNAPSWTEVVTDNCPGVTYTSTHTSGEVFPLGNTTVTYTATDASGNQTITSFVVNVFASSSVTVTVSPSASFCVGEEVNMQVTNASAGSTYSWSFNNTQLGTGSTYQFVGSDINQSGTYMVEVILPGGCLAYGSASVSIDYCELLIPEAVTPNADGMNDTWYIENLENYPNTIVQIVNRWGAVVFESDDYKNDWDGTSQNGMNIGGDELPEGTFYYMLRIGGDEASKFYHKVYTGYIYLKRK